MRTARLKTILASKATTRYHSQGPCAVGSNEQIWTSLQWWPPDVTNGGGRRLHVSCLRLGLGEGTRSHVRGVGLGMGLGAYHVSSLRDVGPCRVMFNALWVMATCGLTDWPTDMYENITFATPLAGGKHGDLMEAISEIFPKYKS